MDAERFHVLAREHSLVVATTSLEHAATDVAPEAAGTPAGPSAEEALAQDVPLAEGDHQPSLDLLPSSASTSSENKLNINANILKGVVAFVDCRSGGEDRFVAVANQLQLLGAVVAKHFNKKVTHVIFSEGKKSTYDRAKMSGVPMVSVIWIESCKQMGSRADEHLFPARIDQECYENPLVKPKNFRCARPWDLETSFEKDAARIKRNRLKREQREYRRRLLDPDYVNPETSFDPDSLFNAPPRVGPTFIFYESSSDEDDKDDAVPPPLTHRLLQKYPDSPILMEAYQRRERLKAEAAAAAAAATNKLVPGEESLDQEQMLAMLPPPTPSKLAETNCFKTRVQKMSSTRTPKRPRAEAFSQSESDGAEEKFQSLQIHDDGHVDVPHSRSSIDEFRVVVPRKPKAKVKRLFSPTPEKPSKCREEKKSGSKSMLVLTSFEFSERETLTEAIKKLGKFQLQLNVSERTSHVVCCNHRRTLNVLQASVRGCWLLNPNWVWKSLEAGKWIDEEPYELSQHFPTAQIWRLQKTTLKCNIFAEVGPIYVGQGTNISQKDLRKLLILAGAKLVESISEAAVVIGSGGGGGDDVAMGKNVRVSYIWALDSIMKNKALSVTAFRKAEQPTSS